MQNSKKYRKGFTLIEIIVAIAIFTFVLFIMTGSIYSIFEANRKSQNTRAVMDSLNYVLEAMTRTIRFGHTYHCDLLVGVVTNPNNCLSGSESIALVDSSGRNVRYRRNITTGTSIDRSIDGGVSYSPITPTDVTITAVSFRVFGSDTYASGDRYQPQVIMVISGYAGVKPTSKTTFTIETTVSQRLVDSI